MMDSIRILLKFELARIVFGMIPTKFNFCYSNSEMIILNMYFSLMNKQTLVEVRLRKCASLQQ